MDSVRFGRILGIGTRLAGKTLVAAVDAATSPAPSAKSVPTMPAQSACTVPPQHQAVSVRTVKQIRATTRGVQRGGRRFGEAVWGPVAHASGVLWLEVTGVFFGLVALVGLDGMWLNRTTLHWATSSREAHLHFLIGAGVALLFGYFCWSSFARAAQRSRAQS